MLKLRLALLALLCSGSLLAQLQVVKSIELPYEDEFDSTYFKPVGEKGILQLAVQEESRDDYIRVRVMRYDTNLKFVSEHSFKMNTEDYDYPKRQFINNQFHFQLKDGDEYLRYIIYDPFSQDTITINYAAQEDNEYLSAQYYDGTLYMAERNDDGISLAYYNLEEKQWHRRPFRPSNVKLKYLEIDKLYFPQSDYGQTDALFLRATIRIKRGLYVNRLYMVHPDGIVDEFDLSTKEIPFVHQLTILDHQDPQKFTLIGTYGQEYSQLGIFAGEINRSGYSVKARYSYGADFDSLARDTSGLLGYFTRRAKRKAREKNEELDMPLLTVSHPVKRLPDGGFLWVAEVFNITYTNTTVLDASGNYTNQQVFDGFQTTQGLVMRLDSNYQKVWDRNFPVVPYHKPLRVKRFLNIDYNEDYINFVYQINKSMSERTFNYNGEVTYKSDTMPLVENKDERVRYNAKVTTDSWYQNYLISYGYLKIKNREDRDKSREVYSLKKMAITKKEE